jgi:hypothetical protein
MKCECGTKIEEFEGHTFCPRCDMVPGSWEEAFVCKLLKTFKLSREAEIEAIQPLRQVASIIMEDARCESLGIKYGDTEAMLNAMQELPFRNKGK